QGWTQMGRIMHVTDTLGGAGTGVNLNGNWQQSSGAQFTALASIGDNLEGAFGFGGYQVYHSEGNTKQQRTMRTLFQNFLTEARVTWFHGDRSAPEFSLTFGNFAYNYNPEVKNLGLYLLRGPVYPGYLMSGFKDFRIDTTKGNVLGARFHHALGNFQQDLIFANERELPPTFDWSLAYVAKYRAFGVVEIGGGVNFHRLIPNESKLETIKNPEPTGDTANPFDTVTYSSQGVKLMAMFNVDLKRMLRGPVWGTNDLKLYGEAVILGVKNYGSYYDDIWQRIPVMIGFNIPTFGLLDYLSLEVEWYGSRYRNTLSGIGNVNSLTQPGTFPTPVEPTSDIPSPVPVSYDDYYKNYAMDKTVPHPGNPDSLGRLALGTGDILQIKGTAWDVENLMTDNWKWSLYLEKTVHRHIVFTAQIANDHYRPRPAATAINEQGGMAEAFTSPHDWYFMFRMGYFF
ncbi:MAG TPA: hypothetical protein DCQ83_02125, partial [Fibrobacteres bacterium]|nr:hypothetical protein [Fibrobacterota bacterium]